MSSKQRKLLFGNNLLETAVKKVEKQQKLIKNKKQSTSNEVMDDEESESESEQEQEQEGKILKQSNAYSFLADLEDVESLSSENISSESEDIITNKKDNLKTSDFIKSTKNEKSIKTKKKEIESDDDLDALLQKYNLGEIQDDKEIKTENKTETEKLINLLSVSQKSLKPDEELQKIFGTTLAQISETRQKKTNHAGLRGMKRNYKSFWLVEVQSNWPLKLDGLSMIFKYEDEGYSYFEYKETEEYKEITKIYKDENLVGGGGGGGDPAHVVSFLQKNPFHVKALLSMRNYYEAIGKFNEADKMLDMALYALECAWHPKFTPKKGNCKLSYEVDGNRTLFEALFHKIRSMSRRLCLKTALECSKFLLSLDFGDPMGITCYMDYLAIRSNKLEFLNDLVNHFPEDFGLSLMPGMTYSIALAKFKKTHLQKTKTQTNNITNENDEDSSLIEAIWLYPLVIVRLMGKIEQKGLVLDDKWKTILKKPLFSSADNHGSASLKHLTNIFVEKNYMLWKVDEILNWLKASCIKASESFDAGTAVNGTVASDWTCVRSQAFPQSETNEFSHLHLYNFTDEMVTLPPEALQDQEGLLLEFNDHLEDIEDQMRRTLENAGIDRRRRLTNEELRNANPILTFLDSFLPWVDVEPPPDDRNANTDNQN